MNEPTPAALLPDEVWCYFPFGRISTLSVATELTEPEKHGAVKYTRTPIAPSVDAAERKVLAVRGSYDAPGFDACVEAELASVEGVGEAIWTLKILLEREIYLLPAAAEDDLRAALKALEALTPPQVPDTSETVAGWRDISTAPRNVEVLTYRAPCGKNYIWGDRIESSTLHDGYNTWTVWPSYLQPTHWMPLPAAPDAEGGR